MQYYHFPSLSFKSHTQNRTLGESCPPSVGFLFPLLSHSPGSEHCIWRPQSPTRHGPESPCTLLRVPFHSTVRWNLSMVLLGCLPGENRPERTYYMNLNVTTLAKYITDGCGFRSFFLLPDLEKYANISQILLPRDFCNFPMGTMSSGRRQLQRPSFVFFYTCLFICLVSMCVSVFVYEQVKDNSQELVPTFHHGGSRDWTPHLSGFKARASCSATVLASGNQA